MALASARIGYLFDVTALFILVTIIYSINQLSTTRNRSSKRFSIYKELCFRWRVVFRLDVRAFCDGE
jgi:hypothetical protein